MNAPQYLTLAGKQKLEEELAELRGPRRAEISRRLKHAIEMGDLSENADYHAAKEDQGFLEGRIQEIEAILSDAEVVDEKDIDHSIVNIGNTVTVQEEGEEEEVYILVGATEANTRERKISYESPLGAALMGHKMGDVVDVHTPGGKYQLKIIRID